MYVINSPTIISETIDGETVIINTVSGRYYTAAGYASIIWEALCGETPVDDVVTAFDKADIFGRDSGIITRFAEELLAERLIVPSSSDTAHTDGPPFSVAALADADLPALTKHDDLQALIELDPIHEVSPQLGWPFDHSATK
tara:strand:- start:5044 stop:5469 length:426 start_codon:yes stop_codon:yes gene_type:complete